MKHLTLVAAGLGWKLLERYARTHIAGLHFTPRSSVFPAVTSVAQATLRTGRPPAEHGLITNAVWLDSLQKPLFWDQSARHIHGARIWGQSTGLFFFQQSLGEAVDVIVSPAPIHRHGGGLTMACYTKPATEQTFLQRRCGTFPLWRYWGPLASARVGRACLTWFEEMMARHDVEQAYLYLPTLDYAAQRSGPASRAARVAFDEFCRQMERVVAWSARQGAHLRVMGDYEITPVTHAPVYPNVILRRKGLFHVRLVAGRAYPDFYQSTAFALCDHEIAVILGPARARAVDTLLATGDYVWSDDQPGDAQGQTVLLAKQGSWCAYPWWTVGREAPDYAHHVDIHNKPGFDPTELFFFGRGRVKGTHGRKGEVAYAEA